jgi:hypothetical protein
MDRYAVCVLPAQHLEDEEQIAFSRLYGPLEVEPDIGRKAGAGGHRRRIAYREIFDISNLDENGDIRGEQNARSSLLQITQVWHPDLSFRQQSAKWANHDEVMQIASRITKQPPERFSWAFTKQDFYRDPNMLPDLAALQPNVNMTRELGFVKIEIDMRKFSDLSFVQEAAQRLK